VISAATWTVGEASDREPHPGTLPTAALGKTGETPKNGPDLGVVLGYHVRGLRGRRSEDHAHQDDSGERTMSLFDTIGSLLGKSPDAQTGVAEALVAALGSQNGGLGGLIQKFEAAGLGPVISSWIGTGDNQAISPDALHGILGSDLVQQIAAKTGLSIEQLLPQIAQHLPQLVDGMTPNGEVPSGSSLLETGLAFLKSRMA